MCFFGGRELPLKVQKILASPLFEFQETVTSTEIWGVLKAQQAKALRGGLNSPST